MTSPILHWQLNTIDIGSDTSGSGLDFTNTDVTLVTDPERGPVASFNGTTSILKLPSGSAPSSLLGASLKTYTTWVKFRGTSTEPRHYFFDHAARLNFNVSSTGALGLFAADNGGNVSTSGGSSFTADTWHHVTVTYDGTKIVGYVDGIEVVDQDFAVDVVVGDLAIGGRASSTLWYLDGMMSDVRVYDSLLTASQIAEVSAPPATDALTIQARAINIPVVIEEVVGAVGYEITYEGPSGVEITAVSGVTTLEHNITGLEADTEYTIKLYTNTGIGYELTEEVVSTTLPNVAASYDVADFGENGVFDISDLEATDLSSMSPILDALFNTGDMVNVALTRNPALNTSFINLGDTLSVKDISGVLLPFDGDSGTGQAVSILLSDDSTTVPVVYDDTTESITVNSVVYYPGDSFILDGKKITVLEV